MLSYQPDDPKLADALTLRMVAHELLRETRKGHPQLYLFWFRGFPEDLNEPASTPEEGTKWQSIMPAVDLVLESVKTAIFTRDERPKCSMVSFSRFTSHSVFLSTGDTRRRVDRLFDLIRPWTAMDFIINAGTAESRWGVDVKFSGSLGPETYIPVWLRRIARLTGAAILQRDNPTFSIYDDGKPGGPAVGIPEPNGFFLFEDRAKPAYKALRAAVQERKLTKMYSFYECDLFFSLSLAARLTAQRISRLETQSDPGDVLLTPTQLALLKASINLGATENSPITAEELAQTAIKKHANSAKRALSGLVKEGYLRSRTRKGGRRPGYWPTSKSRQIGL